MESSQQSAKFFAGVGIPLSKPAIKFPFKTMRIKGFIIRCKLKNPIGFAWKKWQDSFTQQRLRFLLMALSGTVFL
jgi:hypothetical protein